MNLASKGRRMRKRMKAQKAEKGVVTLPAEAGHEGWVIELARRWGADAIRDSDGTRLSNEILNMGYDIYSTICLVRTDQEWAKKNWDALPQKFFMSEPVTAVSTTVEIDLMGPYFREKYQIDTNHDPKKWWEVIDRTTGENVDISGWSFHSDSGKVVIHKAEKFHVYTVNFLVYQIWDSTSMYNHIINRWNKPHIVSVDPYYPKAYRHLLSYFERWLNAHPHTDIVRLTTLAYHFVIDSDTHGNDKYRDWLGYTDTISTLALEDFAREKGYRLRSEDFVDEGYYNATYRIPSGRYLDWMDFIHRFVIRFGKELVDRIHKRGKKAAIFWGDHWIGVEPYSPLFQEMNVDISIGACEDGVALRRLADSPGPQIKEIRLYPYFFSDVFGPGGDPLGESLGNWIKIRRALHRKPVDRIGYGGYLSLAAQFPEFVDHVTDLCKEFRDFLKYSRKTPSYKAPIKVALLNSWGRLRSWINAMGRGQKFLKKRPDVSVVAGSNLLECLSGLPVEVDFMSFGDIESNGIPEDIDIIINNGEAGSSWSGGRNWINEKVVSSVRAWIHEGGGFIGVLGPTAYEHQGRFFQLSDVMGVQKEVGNSCLSAAQRFKTVDRHFVIDDEFEELDLGIRKSFVYTSNEKTQVLRASPGGHVLMAVHCFGRGRSLYLAALPCSLESSRLLYRALLWVSRKEDHLKRWFCTNLKTDCAAYPKSGYYAVMNNVETKQKTSVYDGKGDPHDVTLRPFECAWFPL